MSPRRRIGSVFIRTLVTVFYKYAHIHHIEELAKIVSFIICSFSSDLIFWVAADLSKYGDCASPQTFTSINL